MHLLKPQPREFQATKKKGCMWQNSFVMLNLEQSLSSRLIGHQ